VRNIEMGSNIETQREIPGQYIERERERDKVRKIQIVERKEKGTEREIETVQE
jgi:hypothetical protein